MNYLIGNFLAVDRRRKSNQTKSCVIDRYLELDEIEASLNALSQYPANDEIKKVSQRVLSILYCCYFYSGLRIAEAANHTMGNLCSVKVTGFYES